MKVVFCGASGDYFKITDKAKAKLKRLIVEFLNSQIKSGNERYTFQIKADDGFGIVATDACFDFAEQHTEVEYKFHFTWINKETYDALSDDIKAYYADKVRCLESKGSKENGRPIYVLEANRNVAWARLNPYEKKNYMMDIGIGIDSGMGHLVTYIDENSGKDKHFRHIIDWFDSPAKQRKILDLHAASNSIYKKAELVGVRKQRNSSRYYYRIKMKLPDGTPVNIEKGAFANAAQASEARKQHLISLTTQDCENIDRTFEEVFAEFVAVYCISKPALEKKYKSYYNAHIKGRLGDLNIGDTQYELGQIYNVLTNYSVIDKRTRETSIRLSKEYVSGMRGMLCRLYDYAYNQKYIKVHPMYLLPKK